MKIIRTDEITPDQLSPWERDQVYNGLDCAVTAEVLEVLLGQLDDNTSQTYAFSKALQGPILEMRLRGIRVDNHRRYEVIDECLETLEILERNLERIVLEGVGIASFKWGSNDDLKYLFYNRLGIPEIRKQGRPTVDRSALEKMEAYLVARPIVSHLIAMREIRKKVGFLRTGVDPDGRIRTSYNIGGTATGRLSSSLSEFGTGTNLQNVEESLRSILIADKGMKFAKFDGKQLQSRAVGAIEWNLFDDGRYLDACETDDLHTVVAKMCWPKLGWTGDPKHDKDLAETPYYRHYSHRFMCKKLGHGSNFDGQPPTLSLQSRVPEEVVAGFQRLYFPAFPAHRQWHAWTREQIRKHGIIIALDGRKRYFWGRRNDDKVVREALAYDPQSTESFVVGQAMLNIWRSRDAIVMMHDHDALTVQYPEEQEDEIIPKIQAHLRVPIPLKNGRELIIPYDCKVGWNKGEYSSKNPDGLLDWQGGDKRKRSPEVSFLDRLVRR